MKHNPSWRDGTWIRNSKQVHGRWTYYWPGNFFLVVYGREKRKRKIYGDTPEWNGWKLEDGR